MPLSQKSLEHLARGISARVGVVKKRKRHNSDSSDDPDYQCSSFRDDKKSIEKPAKITEPKPKLKEEREVPDLPGEILHRIFLLAIKDVGAIPLLFKFAIFS